MILIASNRFDNSLKKMLTKNPLFRKKVAKCLKLLAANPKHPLLRLHKLSGKENYSISVDMSVRIILHLEKDRAFLLRIGTHDQVY